MSTLVSGLVLTGCASTLSVTYNTEPSGAVLFQGQNQIGYAPTVITYKLSDLERAQGYKVIPETTATWISGVQKTLPESSVAVDQSRKQNKELMLRRPLKFPGIEQDRFAEQRTQQAAISNNAVTQAPMSDTNNTFMYAIVIGLSVILNIVYARQFNHHYFGDYHDHYEYRR